MDIPRKCDVYRNIQKNRSGNSNQTTSFRATSVKL